MSHMNTPKMVVLNDLETIHRGPKQAMTPSTVFPKRVASSLVPKGKYIASEGARLPRPMVKISYVL